ncbi:MAG: hypothetical protein KGH79_05045 [Patescibacteria group bacterium]|nr:hypothetical protein [Patescibacteria group bacterium]
MWKVLLVVAAVCAALLTGWLTLGELNAVVWISVGFAGYAAVQLLSSNLMPTGHGVGGKRHVLGMPIALFAGYLVVLALALFIGLVNDPMLLSVTNANFRVLGLSICYGWAAALVDWYVFSYSDTYYVSEYAARMMLKERGASKEEIERVLAELRTKGILRPLSKKR